MAYHTFTCLYCGKTQTRYTSGHNRQKFCNDSERIKYHNELARKLRLEKALDLLMSYDQIISTDTITQITDKYVEIRKDEHTLFKMDNKMIIAQAKSMGYIWRDKEWRKLT